MNVLDDLDAGSLRDDIPAFRPGDTVKVHVRVVEGNRSRFRSSPAWSCAVRAAASARRSPSARSLSASA